MFLLSKFTKTSPDRQTRFLLIKFQGLRFLYFLLIILCFFIQIIVFETNSGPYGPIRAPMGPILLKKILILIKNHRIINTNIEIVNLEILKVKTWFGDKDLFS